MSEDKLNNGNPAKDDQQDQILKGQALVHVLPPMPNGFAIASFSVAAAAFVGYVLQVGPVAFVVALIAFATGIWAVIQIRMNIEEMSGEGLAYSGIIMSVVVMFLLIFTFYVEGLGKDNPDSPYSGYSSEMPFGARQKDRMAERRKALTRTDPNKRFTDDLNKLIKIDKNLLDDPHVTFKFLHASTYGFTLYTEHANGSGERYIYTD